MYNMGKLLMATGFGDLAGPLETIASGRKLARHISGMGTVMEFNDDKPRKVLILDAKYRIGFKGFGTYDKDYLNPGYPTEDWRFLSTDNNATNTTAAAFLTDEWLNTNLKVKDPQTAKQNCDVWMTFQGSKDHTPDGAGGPITGVPAVEYCRSILVNGTPCDLPNIQTLARIYCDAEALDARDTSKDTHAEFLLGSRNPNTYWHLGGGAAKHIWSSTECDHYKCWRVNYLGQVHVNTKPNRFSVIPVLEL